MRTNHSRLMAAAALSAVLLVGCGSNDGDNSASNGQPGLAQQTVTDVVAFINNLIAGTSNSSEPIDINSLTLTADTSADPAPLP